MKKWRNAKSECVVKDSATFDDHVDGFNRDLVHVVALYPDVDFFGIELYKDVVDGKVIDSSFPLELLLPKFDVLMLLC